MSRKTVIVAGGVVAAAVIAVALIVLLIMRGGPTAAPVEESRQPASTLPVSTTPEALQSLPALPWQEDGLNDLEEVAAQSLEVIREADPATALTLSALPWLADEMLLHELAVLGHIEEIAKADPALARQVAALPWLAEEGGISGAKLAVLAEVRELAVTDSALAKELAVPAWLDDEVTHTDVITLAIIRSMAQEDPELARRAARAPGTADGISEAELEDLTGSDNYFLELLERDHPDIAEIVRGYDWSSRDASGNRKRTSGLLAHPLSRPAGQETPWNSMSLLAINDIAGIDTSLGQKVATLPWVADGTTETEYLVLHAFWRIALLSGASLADDLVSLQWVADATLTGEEISAIHYFSNNPSHRISSPDEDSITFIQLVLRQSWVRDGISSEDWALLVTLSSGCFHDGFCRELIEGRHVFSSTLPIPSGDVDVFAVSRSPLGAAGEGFIFEEIATAIEAIEELMGTPWINPGVIVYVEPEFQYISDRRGFYVPSFYEFGPGTGAFVMISGTDPSSDDDKDVLYHELAHHYLRGPHWLTEGGAEFLTAYVLHASQRADDGWSLQSQYDRLSQRLSRDLNRLRVRDSGACYVPNIHTYNQERGDEICGYRLGNRLLLALYLSLGHEIVSSALQELDQVWRDGGWPGEEEIYQVFLSHTPPGLVDEFHALYEELHGRPVGFDDSTPAPPALSSTPVPTPVPTVVPSPQPGGTVAPSPAPIPLSEAELAKEREVLIALYNATDGPGWENSTNWLSNEPLSSWYGVELDAQGSVVGLWLYQNHLSGPIPLELGNLASLEYLDLEGNQLTGPISPELGNLANLESLSLGDNQLTGPIPPELGNLSRLEFLVLGDGDNVLGNNQLSGPIPPELGNLSSLTFLFLRFNQLSGPIPPELGNLSRLENLALGYNQLTGPIPPELGNLSSLTHLGLVSNQLSGPIPPELGNLSSLTYLHLSSNQLSGPIPPELGSLANLELLYLAGNQLCVPAELAQGFVGRVNLPDCTGQVNQPVATATPTPPPASTPAGVDSESDEPPFYEWFNCPGTTEGAGSVASDRAALVALYEALNGPNWGGDHNWLSDLPLDQWAGIGTNSEGRVCSLKFDGRANGALPPEIGSLTHLQNLNFPTDSRLFGPIPPELGKLTNLGSLTLHGQDTLFSPIPPELGNLVNLEVLVLESLLMGTLPTELGRLGNLKHLELNTFGSGGTRQNEVKLTGEIPPEFGNLVNLKILDFSRNRLSGPIPPELGNLVNLTILDFSGNNLSGSIPPEFGNLVNLKVLDFSRNNLSGPIPPGVVKLANLETLNLANNRMLCVPTEVAQVFLEWPPSFGGYNLPNCTVTAKQPGALPTPSNSTAANCKYDTDGDGLIEVSYLEQLDAIRFDLIAWGVNYSNSPHARSSYFAAFPVDVGEAVCTGGFRGYELTRSLDFNDPASYASGRVNTDWTTGKGFYPLGGTGSGLTSFRGNFDGNGYIISNLYMQHPNRSRIGLFSQLDGTIRGVGLVNADVTGDVQVGGLVGYLKRGIVGDSYVTGSVTGVPDHFGDGGTTVGGLVASVSDSGAISNSYANGTIAGRNYVGGLVGSNRGEITASYAAGEVSSQIYRLHFPYGVAGGLVGYTANTGAIAASYSTAFVLGESGNVGGLVGINEGTLADNYWDIQASGQASGVGAEGDTSGVAGKTTAELQSPTGYTGIYADWNVDLDNADGDNDPTTGGDDPWDFGTGSDYPTLKRVAATATQQQPGETATPTPPPTRAPTTAESGQPAESVISRTSFESSGPPDYTRVTVTDGGTAWGTPEEFTNDSSLGAVAYMLLGRVKSCSFANEESDRSGIVYVKLEELGHLSEYEPEQVCRKASSAWDTGWDGMRITRLLLFDESGTPPVREYIYDPDGGRYVESSAVSSPAIPAATATPTTAPIGGHAANPDDVQALMALYDATEGESWTDKENWVTDAPLGDWHGVTTDNDGRVTELSLSGNNLDVPDRVAPRGTTATGELPEALSLLSSLEELNLSYNQLEGEIPAKLGKLSSLKVLRLQNNDLTGAIPPELGNLANLERLYLSNNSLTGQIPAELGQLDNLTNLGLHDNGFDSESCIPLALRAAVNKVSYDEKGDTYKGNLPDFCEDVERNEKDNLMELRGAFKNRLPLRGWGNYDWPLDADEDDPWKKEWEDVRADDSGRVTHLFLAEKGLRGNIPWQSLAKFENLEYLDLSGNNLSGAIPLQLSQLTKLKYLDLSRNQLTGEIPKELANLGNLREDGLRLYGHEFAGCVPVELKGKLAASYFAPLLAEPEDDIRDEILDLVGVYFPDYLQSFLSELLNQGDLADAINASAIDPDKGLRQIVEASDDFTIRGIAKGAVGFGTILDVLDLLTQDWFISWVQGSTTVTYGLGAPPCPPVPTAPTTPLDEQSLATDREALLEIRAYYLDNDRGRYDDDHPRGENAYAFSEYPCGLFNRSVCSADFDWPEQGHVSKWHGVTVEDGRVVGLEITDRLLEGGIPTQVGDLGALKRLNLSRNRLSGPIPRELGNLVNLEHLSLNGKRDECKGSYKRTGICAAHRLSGVIPKELGNLTKLKVLHLHENNFVGQLPYELGNAVSLAPNKDKRSPDDPKLREVNFRSSGLTGCLPPNLQGNFDTPIGVKFAAYLARIVAFAAVGAYNPLLGAAVSTFDYLLDGKITDIVDWANETTAQFLSRQGAFHSDLGEVTLYCDRSQLQ